MMVAPHRMGSDILRDAVARRSKRTLLGLSSSSMASLGTRERGSGTSSPARSGESMASQARVMAGPKGVVSAWNQLDVCSKLARTKGLLSLLQLHCNFETKLASLVCSETRSM